MEKKEFLGLLGSGTASFLLLGCLGGCSKKDNELAVEGTNHPSTGKST